MMQLTNVTLFLTGISIRIKFRCYLNKLIACEYRLYTLLRVSLFTMCCTCRLSRNTTALDHMYLLSTVSHARHRFTAAVDSGRAALDPLTRSGRVSPCSQPGSGITVPTAWSGITMPTALAHSPVQVEYHLAHSLSARSTHPFRLGITLPTALAHSPVQVGYHLAHSLVGYHRAHSLSPLSRSGRVSPCPQP